MKKIWIPVAVILVGLIVFLQMYANGNGTFTRDYVVEYQDIEEVVSEIGKIVPVTEISMTFPAQGVVSAVNVSDGDTVSKGDLLMKLDTAKTQANLANAQAAVAEAQARLDKAYSGASREEITLQETAVKNAQDNLFYIRATAANEVALAQTTLTNAQNDYDDISSSNDEDIKQAYENAVDILREADTKADTSLKTIDYIQEKFFDSQQYTDKQIQNGENSLDNKFLSLTATVDAVSASDHEGVDSMLGEMNSFLLELADLLRLIRASLENEEGVDAPSVTEEGYVDTARANIDTAITNVNSAVQTISSVLIDNSDSLNDAQAAIDEAQANLAAVQSTWDSKISEAEGSYNIEKDELSVLTAAPRSEDIALYQAQLNQAIAYVAVIQQDYDDSYIYAPVDGVITNVFLEVGELATLSVAAVSMVAAEQYEIEAEISELDIAHISVGDSANITFDSFGRNNVFGASVVEIDPYETIIDSDVFYRVTLQLDEFNAEIRSGMTANIKIMTDSKESVLVVPSRYVGEEGGIDYVKLKTDENEDGYIKIEVHTGLEGLDFTEIESGLEEGDVIVPYY